MTELVWSHDQEPDMWIIGSTMEEAADESWGALNGSIGVGERVTVFRGDADPDEHIANELDDDEMTHRISNITSVSVMWDGSRWNIEH